VLFWVERCWMLGDCKQRRSESWDKEYNFGDSGYGNITYVVKFGVGGCEWVGYYD